MTPAEAQQTHPGAQSLTKESWSPWAQILSCLLSIVLRGVLKTAVFWTIAAGAHGVRPVLRTRDGRADSAPLHDQGCTLPLQPSYFSDFSRKIVSSFYCDCPLFADLNKIKLVRISTL